MIHAAMPCNTLPAAEEPPILKQEAGTGAFHLFWYQRDTTKLLTILYAKSAGLRSGGASEYFVERLSLGHNADQDPHH